VLTKDLTFDWRAGAELFQWLLSDHDLASNWGNWAYFAGVGADPKDRHFCSVSQGVRYDSTGAYALAWMTTEERTLLGIDTVQGAEATDPWRVHWPYRCPGWPVPLVDPLTQLTQDDRAKLELGN
jgi:deoxyribodipyrimidine photo-lyase